MVIERLKRVSTLLLLACALTAPVSTWAALRAYVDRNPVAEDETFTLTLESDDGLDGSPDLGPLRRDFDIRDQARSSSINIVNGSMSRKTQWQISLMAKHGGRITIPGIRVGGAETNPISLEVTAADQAPSSANGGGALFVDVSLEPKSVYVQQQAVYTVRLYHAVNLGSGSTLSEPAFPNGEAAVEKLGKDKEFETVRNGMRYAVLERQYAIYPQKSGGIEIPALVFDGRVVQGGGFFAFDPFNPRTFRKRLRSQPLRLDVRPVPAAFHGAQWLPAAHLGLTELWAPDPPHFVVGQAVTRTLRIDADGLMSSQLPVLAVNTSVDGVKQYPDQPSLSESPGGAGLSGSRSEKIAYIPQKAERIVLPAIEIPWWNTRTDREEVARLPKHTITIEPAAGNTAPVAATSNAAQTPVAKALEPPVPGASLPAGANMGSAAIARDPGRWPWIALLLGFGWSVTAGSWWWRSRRSRRRPEPKPDPAVPLRALERAIREGCRANDPVGTKAAILAWAGRRWPERPPLSLTAVARRCPEDLAVEMIALDRTLYAPGEGIWQGDTLWRRYVECSFPERDEAKGPAAGLEPLYPVS
ncbi:MAG: hypothetical protein GC138_05245 [Gammaproteobacteria bacterium]|nr:hypothetical protein [Gammaproteobacteria bacterium]